MYSKNHHACFICEDESVWGFGYRGHHGRNDYSDDIKFRKIPKPEECKDYKKVTLGKFSRIILTNSGKVFFNGQNKKYMLRSSVDVNAHVSKFGEIKDLFPIDDGDKIIDIASGKHFLICVTEQGKCYGSGYIFYRYLSQCRRNSQNDEDHPYELKLPQGYKAVACWASCDYYSNAWVNAVKEDGATVTFAVG